MKRFFLKLLPFLILFASKLVMAAEVQWQPQDIRAAFAKAGAEGKLVYVFVEGDNCPPCDEFKTSHLSDPAYVDFVNTLYVPIRAHVSDAGGKEFLRSLKLVHAAVPRFYILSPDGRGVSMSIGMVAAPPMGAADALKLAPGRELPVDKAKAARLAGRIRAHAASQRSAGALNSTNPLRHIGLAILEAQAWALANRLDEAEEALGVSWADQLVDQDVRLWYVNFWLGWKRNLRGALLAAREYRDATPEDPMGLALAGRAEAANGNFTEAVRIGEALLRIHPDSPQIVQMVDQWRMGGR